MYKIFVSALVFDQGKSGISNYIENCVYNLALNNEIYLAILKSDIKNYTRTHKNIHFIVYPDLLKHTALNIFFHFIILPFLISNKYDFIFLPAANRRLMIYYPLYTIASFHDLSQFYIKKKYDCFRMFYIKHFIPLFLRGIDKIVAVSNNTKSDMLKYLKVKEENIIVNPNGFDKNLYDKNKTTKTRKFNLTSKYILYISRIEHPGKNHINLIKAYENLPLELKNTYDLVLVGSDCGNANFIHEYVNKSKDKKHIKFLGFVKNEDMPFLFSRAKLFVFPSLYEGFGIPLIEAMAMNVPVACASNSSLIEIGKDVCFFFDEYDEINIKNSIMMILYNEKLQTQMKKAGLQRAKQYDWRCHAKKIIKLYEKNKFLQYSKTLS